MTKLNWKGSDGSRYGFGALHPACAARASREVGGVYYIHKYPDCYSVSYKPRGSQVPDALGEPTSTLREAMDVAEADHSQRQVQAREFWSR